MGPQVEAAIRIGSFVSLLLALATWEALAQRRKLTASKTARWFGNFALLAINSVAVRLAFAVGIVGVASEAQAQQWGLFNNIDLPNWLEIVLAVVLLDFAIYLQHVLFHAVPLLWRLHMVHHADPDFDVTTGLRFHTLEIALSLGIKVVAVILLGAAPLAVLLFEVLLNATSMFSHSNVRMPAWIDSALRCFVVTPDMHRVHHSMIPQETNSNYGFNVPWWDYLLGTYRAQPRDGHEAMRIGLEKIPASQAVGLHWLLALPFVGERLVGQKPELPSK
jgi:sterol desaturase/sphingolipid hydroxylase (fatty acid hydroxylase superfamily)